MTNKPLKYGKSALVVVAGAFFFIGVLMGMLTLNIIEDRLENSADIRLPLGYGNNDDKDQVPCRYIDESFEINFMVPTEWECDSQYFIKNAVAEQPNVPNTRVTGEHLDVVVAFPFEAACQVPEGCDEVEVYSDDNVTITFYDAGYVFGSFSSDVVSETVKVRVVGELASPEAITDDMISEMADLFSDLEVREL